MSAKNKLNVIRETIDALDVEIQALISKRAECARQVADVKQASNVDAAFYRPEREAEVLRAVQERNSGPLSDEEMARLFREIMSACLALEQPMTIAYLGPEGTFTQAAALKHFGHSVTTSPFSAIDEVFRDVESGASHYGVVPVENSTEGVVNHTLDMFMRSPLTICGEVDMRIHHHLCSNETSTDDVMIVYSHQQSLAQCREWLDARLPTAVRIPVATNAEAAKLASKETGAAAICSSAAAEIYALNVLEANIEDEPDNTTRFLIIGKHETASSGDDKTSLLLAAENRPGALTDLLMPFTENAISMTRVESRPSRRGTWEYVFFIDIDGHQSDEKIAHALNAISKRAALMKILGSYPKAVL